MALDEPVDKGKNKELVTFETVKKDTLPTPGSNNFSSAATAPERDTKVTKIPKQTRFFASTPFIAEKGDLIQKADTAKKGDTIQNADTAKKVNPIQQRVATISMYMTTKLGFQHAKADYFRKYYTVFFDSEFNLAKTINEGNPIQDLDNVVFTPMNSQIARIGEHDKTIRVIDIPLHIKSDIVKQFFSQFGIIQRFSMVSRGAF